MSNSARDRSIAARIAAHARWARTDDRAAATASARLAFDARFEDLVDPDRNLPDSERSRRAAHARSAYFLGLARVSAAARRRRS